MDLVKANRRADSSSRVEETILLLSVEIFQWRILIISTFSCSLLQV